MIARVTQVILHRVNYLSAIGSPGISKPLRIESGLALKSIFKNHRPEKNRPVHVLQ
jgi:hypothetical protein